ncbi:MAG: SURF1 family protein [Gemmatimonadaceae bacterium]
MSRSKLGLFVAFALAAAAGCVRLGFWQLHRLGERRARNALIVSRLDSAAVDPSALPRDTAAARFRRVRVTGVPDYDHELIYATRTRLGSPGVNLLTPIRRPGTDTAVLVNRGWVYSPDGSTIDASKWHDRDSVFVGYAEEMPSAGGATFTTRPNVVARLSYDVVAKALPYPVLPVYVVALAGADTTVAPDRIARLEIPPLDEGPHMSYAIQWFGFALVALVGVGFVIRQAREADRPNSPAASTEGGE